MLRIFIYIATFITFSSVTHADSAPNLALMDDGLTAGYATLEWQGVPGHYFVLEEKTSTGWQFRYQGPDHATTLSGLADGTYTFRLRASDGNGTASPEARVVGAPITLTVAHHPLSRAWSFFSAGAVMFAALITLLAIGTRQTPLTPSHKNVEH